MRTKLSLLLFGLLVITLLSASPVRAESCVFVLGFKAHRDQVGHNVVGDCLGNEHWHVDGARQWTTNGALYWNKKTGAVTFVAGDKPPTPIIPTTSRPHAISGEMIPVLDYLRSTGPWGRYWHSRVYEWKTDVIFKHIRSDWDGTYGYAFVKVNQVGAWSPRPDEETILLASIIVHEMAHIRWHRSEGGRYINSPEECYLKELDGEQQSANWLREAGHEAKAKQLYTTIEEVKRIWRQYCEAFRY